MHSKLLPHAAHIAAPALVLFLSHGKPLLALPAAAALFLSAFAAFHDTLHGSLGLSRGTNDRLMSSLGVLLGVSGHVTRHFHMAHHARPLGPDDVEGRGASLPLGRAVFSAPFAYLNLPRLGWRRMPPRTRRAQGAEWGAVLFFLALCATVPFARPYLAVVLAAQLTIPLWASRLPHRASPSLLSFAGRLRFTRHPVVLSLLYHELHHAHPRVSLFEWPQRCFPRAVAPPAWRATAAAPGRRIAAAL